MNIGEKPPGRAPPRYEPSAAFVKCCAFEEFRCRREPISGEAYCLQHCEVVREGRLKYCTYVSSLTGERCNTVVGKDASSKEGYCPHHSRQIVRLRRIAATRKRKHANQLDHSKVLAGYGERYGQFSAQRNKPAVPNETSNSPGYRKVVDHHSEPDLVDVLTDMPVASFDEDLGDFDFDEVVMNDPLRNAGVFTAEEIARLMRDKMIRLQKLYLDEFSNLSDRLAYNYAEFKKHVVAEKATLGPLNQQTYRTVEDRKKLKMLKSRRRYHRVFGREALLRDQKNAKRSHFTMEIDGGIRSSREITKSQFTSNQVDTNVVEAENNKEKFGPPENVDSDDDNDGASSSGGLVIDEEESREMSVSTPHSASGSAICLASPCANHVLPYCNFCSSHIHLDKRQLLFRPCSVLSCPRRANVATAYACDPQLIKKQKESEYGDETVRKLSDRTPQFCDKHCIPRTLHKTPWAERLLKKRYKYEPKPSIDATEGEPDDKPEQDGFPLSNETESGIVIESSLQLNPSDPKISSMASSMSDGDKIEAPLNQSKDSLDLLIGANGRPIIEDYPNLVREPNQMLVQNGENPPESLEFFRNFTVPVADIPPPSDTLDEDILEILSDDSDDENNEDKISGNLDVNDGSSKKFSDHDDTEIKLEDLDEDEKLESDSIPGVLDPDALLQRDFNSIVELDLEIKDETGGIVPAVEETIADLLIDVLHHLDQ